MLSSGEAESRTNGGYVMAAVVAIVMGTGRNGESVYFACKVYSITD